MIGFVLSLMLHYISYHLLIVLTELTRALKKVPCVYRAFLYSLSSKDSVYRVHSGDKGDCEKLSVNQAHSVNEGNLDGTSVNPKEVAKVQC